MNLKQSAAEEAAKFVEDGMVIGLGTGSTVYWTTKRLGQMVREGLKIRAVPTSLATEKLMAECGIPQADFADTEKLDLTIDGADEISPELDLVKGGGGALFREKLVAAASERLIIVADESKLVPALGRFPLPVEIVPFGWEVTTKQIENLRVAPTLRRVEKQPFITDNGNFILDCACGVIEAPPEFHNTLKQLTGVVETGLFINMVAIAVVAGAKGIKILERNLGDR